MYLSYSIIIYSILSEQIKDTACALNPVKFCPCYKPNKACKSVQIHFDKGKFEITL